LLTWLEDVCRRHGVVVAPEEMMNAIAHLADVGLMLFIQTDATRDPAAFTRNRELFLDAVPRVSFHAALWTALSSSSGRQELSNTLHDVAEVFAQSESTFRSAKTLQDGVAQLIESIRESGFIYQPWQVACYVTALRTKPFVILAGVSGTGKTKLPRLVSVLTGTPEPFRVAVRPDWTDSSDVLGYVDLQRRFRPGLVLQQLRRASGDVLNFHTCLLDEMNLARVEHYLAEYLSAVEECVPCSGGGFRSTRLLGYIQGEDDAEWATQVLPPNFAIVGTVNMDETTQAFSRKVLDRAFTIELSDIDLQVMGQVNAATWEAESLRWPLSWWIARYRRISDVPDECREFDSLLDRVIRILTLANTVLIQAQLQLGYRTRDEIALFLLNAADVQESFRTLSGEPVDPLDLGLMMKVLPRLVGSSNLMRQILSGLIDLAQTGTSADVDTDAGPTVLQWETLGQQAAFRGAAFPYTLARLCLMYQRLERDGYTSFWL
ncbi:MAG: McrB family protein, partial [Planctomycetota bacterium]